MPRLIYDGQWVRFTCPGCRHEHSIDVESDEHAWNRDTESPTLRYSVCIARSDGGFGMGHVDHPQELCCFLIHSGWISFLPGSSHQLAGQVVKLPELQF